MDCHPVPCPHAWIETALVGTAYARAERCLDCGAVRFTTHAHLLMHLPPGAPREAHYCASPLCAGHADSTQACAQDRTQTQT
jgi:hypothetical protein